MKRNLKAIYENGVFRPLEAVGDCPEHQEVDVFWPEEDCAEESLVDPEFEQYCRKLGETAKPIEEVRQALARIPGSLSKFIRAERDAD